MKIQKIAVVCSVVLSVVLFSGCAEDRIKNLKDENRVQQDAIVSLESELNATKLKYEQTSRKLEAIRTESESAKGLRDEQIDALEKDSAAKKDLVLRMQGQLLSGGVRLPMELSVLLQDFANANNMVTFDEGTGMVKFKSDLVFSSGSDKVTSNAKAPIKALCSILNNQDGKKFDVVVVGHTDTVPISKPSTRALHPTNWHLSVHRAISVSRVMMSDGISAKRVSVKGFGEYRPFVANNPGNKGTAANRRVEILIVPSGTP